MNLNELRTQSRLKAAIPSADFSTANLTLQLNNSYYELSSVLASMQESYFAAERVYIDTAVNSAYYDLPGDFQKLKQARVAYSTPSDASDYTVATGYEIESVRDVGADEENISTANPIIDIVGSQIKLKPTPTAAVTSGIQLNYIARPSAMVLSSDIPVIPTEWHDLMATYAAREMCLRFGKSEKWQMLQASWNAGIERFKNELAERDTNEPMRFRTPYEAGTKSSSELYG